MSRKHVISKRFIGSDDPSDVEQGGGFTSISSDYTSEVLNLAQTDKASFHLQWENSTLVATVLVQVRNGNDETDNWRTIDITPSIDISGASGEHEIILIELPFTSLRFFIDVASGSGDVGCSFSSKSVGA